MSAQETKPRAKTRQAGKAVIPAATVNDTISAISLIEVTMLSLESQEIGSIQQVVLKLAITKLWAIHDNLIEVAVADDADGSDL